MSAYRIDLDMFAGPMDLLLYLVRKEEVDIYDIPIAEVTDQYIRYIDLLKSLDIDLAGSFLVMAATLMQIKSAMLLPKAEPDQVDAEEGEDPRAELIRQLLEYKKYKDAANFLNDVADEHKQRYARPDSVIEHLKGNSEPELDLDQVSIWDLLEAFDTVCKSIGVVADILHIQDDTPIDLYQIEILHRLQSEGQMTFERIFESAQNRLVMVGLFLGLLEMIRDRLVWADQESSSGAIYLKALTDEPAEQAVQRAILDFSETDENANSEADTPPSRPPIAIQELPAQKAKPSRIHVTEEHTPLPISEISGSGRAGGSDPIPQEQSDNHRDEVEEQAN